MSDERGASVSVFVAVVVFALLIAAGLVVVGGRQSAAQRAAQVAAADAARAGQDACAAARVAGRAPAPAVCVQAAQARLAAAGMPGLVVLSDPVTVRVETATSVPTVFLSLIGINSLRASGSAEAQLVAR